MIQNATPRVVLDSNVCVDLFVFHDPRWAALRSALEEGRLQAFTRDDCRREFRYVLHYPHLPLDEAKRAQAAEDFDRLFTCLKLEDYLAPDADEARLPVCKDREDQKFLETARQAGNAVLVTKDKALLKLAKRRARLGQAAILTPEAWTAAWQAGAPEVAGLG